MGEPIRLYNQHGALVVLHSPSLAADMVASGALFVEPPVLPVELEPAPLHAVVPPEGYADAPLDNWTDADPKDVRFEVTYTPDDTQDAPVVPTGRARRKSNGGGGVL